MADLDLDELARLEKAATPGPWRWLTDDERRKMSVVEPTGWLVGPTSNVLDYAGCGSHDYEASDEDKALIAALRNAAPALLAAEARAEKAEAILHDAVSTPASEWAPTLAAMRENVEATALLLKEAETRAQAAEALAASRYDCHGGPGTTTTACGACVTCVQRGKEAAEDEAARLRLNLDNRVRLVFDNDALRKALEEIAVAAAHCSKQVQYAEAPRPEPTP